MRLVFYICNHLLITELNFYTNAVHLSDTPFTSSNLYPISYTSPVSEMLVEHPLSNKTSCRHIDFPYKIEKRRLLVVHRTI